MMEGGVSKISIAALKVWGQGEEASDCKDTLNSPKPRVAYSTSLRTSRAKSGRALEAEMAKKRRCQVYVLTIYGDDT